MKKIMFSVLSMLVYVCIAKAESQKEALLENAPPVYVRVTLLGQEPADVPVQAALSVFRQYCHFAHASFGKMMISASRGRMDVPTGFDDFMPWDSFGDADYLVPGQASPWMDIRDVIYNYSINEYSNRGEFVENRTLAFSFNSPALPALTGNAPRPNPRRAGSKPDRGNLHGVTVRIEVADAPSADHIVKSFDYTSDTSIVALALWGTADADGQARTPANYDKLETVQDGIRRFLEGLKERGLQEGPVPERFLTTTWLHHGYMFSVFDSATTHLMSEVMRRMGFNTVHWYITKPMGLDLNSPQQPSVYAFEAPIDPSFAVEHPWVENFEKRVREKVTPVIEKWKEDVRYQEGEPIWVKLGDEIFLIRQEIILENPASHHAFQRWLRERGVTPQDVGYDNAAAIRPIALDEVHDVPSSRCFYYTSWFRQEVTAEWWRDYVAVVRDLFGPGAYIGTESCYNGFRARPDYFLWSRMGFMDTMLHEYTTKIWVSPHSAIFRAVLHQSASRLGQESSGGLWCTDRVGSVPGIEITGMTALIRQMKNLYAYQYFYPTENYMDWSAAIGRVNQLASQVEDDIFTGTSAMNHPEVAILHSRSTEIWADTRENPGTGGWDGQGFGGYYTEKNMLVSALAYQHIPMEFLPEEEVADRLKDYKVLFITDGHVSTSAQDAIEVWVRDGGVLFTVAGAAERDEFNQPSSLLNRLAESAGAVEPIHVPSVRYTEYIRALHDLPALDRILWSAGEQAFTLETVARQNRIQWPGADILAVYEDGSPAAIAAQVGGGRVMHIGTSLGAVWARTASESLVADIIARRGYLQTDQRHFDPLFLQIYGSPLEAAGIQSTMQVSAPGVDGAFYELEGVGGVILLADYNSGSDKKPQLRVRTPHAYSEARLLLPDPASPGPWTVPLERDGEWLLLSDVPMENIQAVELR